MAAIYCADVWCDDCASDIRLQIQAEGRAPEDPSDEHSYDSDEYPKYMCDNEAADCPQHCASGEECLNAEELEGGTKVGCLLTDSLTDDGVEYVKEAVKCGGVVADFWRQQFDWIDFDD